MRHMILRLLCLTWVVPALFPQSLSFPDGLVLFRINRVEVDRGDWTHLRLWGEDFDGSEEPLFSGPGIPSRSGRLGYVYLDDDIRYLRGEIKTSAGKTVQLSAEVRRPAFRISVFGFPGSLEGGGLWQSVSSEKELGPGDVYVLPPERDPAPIIAAGIHVLTPRVDPYIERDPRNPWRGYLLYVQDQEATTLSGVLESRREEIISFKQRYQNLPVSLGFHGPQIPRENPLVFPTSEPVTIARLMQVEAFRDRIGPLYRYALLAFSFTAIAAMALIRSWKTLLPLMGTLLAAFVFLSIAAEVKPRTLTIEFALPDSQGYSNSRPMSLEPVGDPQQSSFHYRQSDIAPGSRILLYRALLAPGGEASLSLFADDPRVRFNQIPEVQQRNGMLLLKFRNPLSAWSLHEAQ
jgi:hypothetical protein